MASTHNSSTTSNSSPERPLAQIAAGAGEESAGNVSQRVKISSACDSCKRRKIKCTGTQPCDRCRTSGLQCTYGSATGRPLVHCSPENRSTAVNYTRHLEERVAELEALLRQRPATQSIEQQEVVEDAQHQARPQLVDSFVGPEDDYVFTSANANEITFHGRFAGLSMLRTIRDLCNRVARVAMPSTEISGEAIAQAFDTTSTELPPYGRIASVALLPSRERVEAMISIALDHAMNAHHCIDRAELNTQILRLYDRDPEYYTREDHRCLGLMYALMALGRRHDSDSGEDSQRRDSEIILLKGATYFRAAKSIFETSEGYDLNSIRTLLVLSVYLLSSSMASKAFEYISIAAAHALRMGLHTKPRPDVSPADAFAARQVFSVLNLMDTYTSSTLGMPNSLRGLDPEQTIPVPEGEVHDLGRSFAAREPLSPLSETILSTRLFAIQAKIIQSRFAPSKMHTGEQGTYELDYQGIADREAELEAWHQELPDMSPTTVDHRVLRTQLILRISYASVQICLYRPFLHHLIRDGREQVNYTGYAFGSSCIRASTQAIWLIDTFDRHGYLHEAQWFNIFILALAASSLMLFVLGTGEGPTVDESRLAALKAQALLNKLAKNNLSARRSRDSLSRLAEQLRGPGSMMADPESLSPRSRFMIAIGAVDLSQEDASGIADEVEPEAMSTGS